MFLPIRSREASGGPDSAAALHNRNGFIRDFRIEAPCSKQAVRQLLARRGLFSSKTDRSKKDTVESVFDRVFSLYLPLLPSSSADISRFFLDSLLHKPS